MPLYIHSSLPDDTERLVERIIGCGIEVHKALGPGLLESIYAEAMAIEFRHQRIAFDREREVRLTYRGIPLRPHRLDLIVEDKVIIELKAIEQLKPVHGAQVLSYLHATGIQVGLLMNFNSTQLKNGLRRFVL